MLTRVRWTGVLLLLAALLPAGCGSKAATRDRHAQAAQTPDAAPPTPDMTPVEALRTPAGLVLKVGEPPPAVTPSPSPSGSAEPTKPAA